MNLKRLSVAFLFTVSLAGAAKTPLTDDMIRDKVKIKLAADQVAKGGGFDVDVKNGVVTLAGKADTEKQKGRAEKLAHKVAGVKSVENHLQVVKK